MKKVKCNIRKKSAGQNDKLKEEIKKTQGQMRVARMRCEHRSRATRKSYEAKSFVHLFVFYFILPNQLNYENQKM